MATVTKPIILDETGQAMVTALQTIATHAAGLVGQGVPASGTTGQVLAKKSNTDYDTEWITPSGSTTEVFWATYGLTPQANIEAAYQAKKIVMMQSGGMDYCLASRTSATYHTFAAASGNTIYTVTCNNGSWSNDSKSMPSASSNTPQPLGTATPGVQNGFSRADHVHAMPSASDVGAIASPSSPATGAFLVWNGSAWVAQTLAVWQASSY